MELFNLLLVDDEPYILDGLQYNIDWREIGITEVYTANNTETALKILHNHRVDVVITDIQMPGDNGLVLGDHILQDYPYTKTIILSGYQNFSYAQRSVDIKAFRYLLKPIQYEELEQTVAEALDELKIELQREASLKAAKADMEDAAPVLQKHFMACWLEKDTILPWEGNVDPAKYGLPLQKGDWVFFVMLRMEHCDLVMEEEYHLVAKKLCQDILSENCRMMDYLNSQGIHSFFFFQSDSEKMQDFSHRAVERLDLLLSAMENRITVPIRIFWSEVHPLEQLGNAYREINRKLLRYLGNSHNVICSGETILGPAKTMEMKALHQHPSIGTIVASSQKEAATHWIDTVFSEMDHREDNCYEQYLQVYHLIVGTIISDSIQRQMEISEWADGFFEFMENIGATAADELRRKCVAFVERYMDHLIQWQASQEKHLVTEIKNEIHERVGEPVSVSSLAAQFSYNPTYLSRIFKDQTGLPLQDYIIHAKMDAAKLLLPLEKSAGDVARAVGYENYPNFSRMFKKVVGVSPKQYQDMNVKNDMPCG